MNVMNEFILRPLRVVVRKASEVRRRTLEFESRIEIAPKFQEVSDGLIRSLF